MFSHLIEDCVRGGDGGFVTSGLEKPIEWITQEDTEFPGEPGRWIGEPRKLYIRKVFVSGTTSWRLEF